MKYIWEVADIKGGSEYGFSGLKETWIIGYRPELDSTEMYVSVSTADGMITLPHSKEELARKLTENGAIPKEFMK